MYLKIPGLIWAAVLSVYVKSVSWTLRILNRRNIIVTVVLCAAIAGLVLTIVSWEWLGAGESGSSTIRNVGLVGAGLIALPLALWRSIVADRQAKTAQESLLNERYQRGAEMLGNEVLSVRLGGIYALQRLAEEHPEQYHVQIMRLFCAFARFPTKDDGRGAGQVLNESGRILDVRQDVEAIIQSIGIRSKFQMGLEREHGFKLDLQWAVLPRIQLLDLDLSNAFMQHCQLPGANIANSDLTDTFLNDADLSGAEFHNVTFRRTGFSTTNLVGAMLQEAKMVRVGFHNKTNLSGANLDRANLTGAIFENAILTDAFLTGAILPDAGFLGAELQGARLMNADLTGAHFLNANLHKANLAGANVSGVEFSNRGHQAAKGLTQAQLDQAWAGPKDPPKLAGVVDCETGEPLVWRGKPVKSL